MWRDLSDLPREWLGCVATIGVFDGLHRGHQALIDHARRKAADLGVPSMLVTFDPHPLEVLRPGRAPRLLATLAERVESALDAGVDGVFVHRFDQTLAQLPAATWIEEFLVRGLHVRSVVVGEDFKFGAGNLGDVKTLRTLGDRWNFTIVAVPLVHSEGARCSSTRVRELRDAGRIAEARALLGRPTS